MKNPVVHNTVHFLSLYAMLVSVGTSAIFVMAHVSFWEALTTASVACLFKSVAVKVHHWGWGRLVPVAE